ncbi:MAG TPA: hypothetical protein VJH95_02230 [Candidatus Nanoarchaeia archaeon]|nr:hypothetical protein [Candidatus Nanoarchaeia archaeon]
MKAYFVALTPDHKTEAEVAKAKLIIADRFGKQKYLFDPPHSTIYVSLAQDLAEVEKRLSHLAAKENALEVEIAKEWQEFPNDLLAGGGTSLALKFREEDKAKITKLQKLIVNVLNDLRKGQVHHRYQNATLPPLLAKSIKQYGFPFVDAGDSKPILLPHINLCCFNPPENAELFKKLCPIEKFSGPATLPKISLYLLHPDDKTELITSYPLKS